MIVLARRPHAVSAKTVIGPIVEYVGRPNTATGPAANVVLAGAIGGAIGGAMGGATSAAVMGASSDLWWAMKYKPARKPTAPMTARRI
jgi:hypothetical protein